MMFSAFLDYAVNYRGFANSSYLLDATNYKG
jgi:hypothetical protein